MEIIRCTYPESANKLLSSNPYASVKLTENFLTELNWMKLSTSAARHFLVVALTVSVLGVAEQALAAQKVGNDGPEVASIQRCLKQLGYFKGKVTGKFASKTREAVIRFQRDNRLPTVGVVGNQTQQLLRSQCQSKISGGGRVGEGLRRGSNGASVRRLQQDLQRLGYFSGNITGYFGSETERAVSQFQQSNGIRPDGIVGPRTQEAIRVSLNQPNYPPNQPDYYPPNQPNYPDNADGSYLKLGDSGQEVRRLQEDLQQLGYFRANPTGYYGSTTQEAVERFQQNYGLTRSGVADSQTLARISDALAGGTNPANSNCSVNQGDICLGERSQRVEIVQRRLQDLGFFQGRITNYYGPATRNAVVQFQRSRGLEANGFVNYETWQALALSNPGSSPGNSGGYPDFPGNAGNPPEWTPGRENRYVVIVPIRSYDTLSRVRQYVPSAFQADSRLGTYVNAGQYNTRAEAERQSDYLRERGLDARVEYF
ncbi:peptidoglycan-binding protein [Scytonema sp. UIC 10036]|uniref:peptidoglycan-binding domain-containing protein n=1 Tax=Scytonema sp. UIC 10036 TaxID=2304196 RepID=UPI0012DA6C41|nr:peptidoglycan-binding protein [Scytonema sp. UIC 10036]MUG97809.1 peptidoglycan-binding protein [Scytonema sp. UIC 10036]